MARQGGTQADDPQAGVSRGRQTRGRVDELPYHVPMVGSPRFGPAPDLSARSRTPLPRPAVDPIDLRAAVDHALADGLGAGLVYAQLLRPVLADATATAGSEDERALARSTAHAALAELTTRLPVSDEGLGRRAAVVVPPGLLGGLDGRALADALEAGGWTAITVTLDDDAPGTLDHVETLDVEVVVLPAADPAQLERSAAICSLLRRTIAPPLIIGVVFDPAGETTAMAADHVLGTTDALAALLRRRIVKGAADVAWGVRLGRDAEGLVVTPVGLLDPTSVARLREVVETRRGLYPRILIDLRDLVEPDALGLAALVSWDAEQPWDPTVAALSDPRTIAALSRAGLRDALPLAGFAL